MAKRFTDTDKWKKNNFTSLSKDMKLVWFYLCDCCDNAGVWDINIGLLNYQTGCSVSIEEIQDAFGDKIRIQDDRLILTTFTSFQYGELNEQNRAHQSVINRLKKLAISYPQVYPQVYPQDKPLASPLQKAASPFQGAKDKDKDKDKDKEKDKEKEKETLFDFDALYAEYPRHEGKAEGMKRCKAQIKTQQDYDNLKMAIANYKAIAKEPYIKHFSSFMTNWKDYIEKPKQNTSQNSLGMVLNAISKFGHMRSQAAKEYLGEALWERVKASGGWYEICILPDKAVRDLFS
jgi:hypothetical protein